MRATIITAGGLVLKPLIEALGRAGVHEAAVFANAIGDAYMFEPPPDFVVAVLSPLSRESQEQGMTNLDVMLRVGRSVERKLPTLLIVPPPLTPLAATVGVSFAHCPIDHDAALDFHLSALIATVTTADQPLPEQAPVSPNAALRDIAEYLSHGPALSETELEQLVTNIFQRDKETHAFVSQPSLFGDAGVDAVIAPAGAPNNVIFLQAKQAKPGNVTEPWLSLAEDQLQHLVVINRASLGLLVYYDPDGIEFPTRSSTPLVISIPLRRFVEQLASQSLAQLLNDATAKAAGGASQ